jgi:hypothetical protein
MQITHAHHSDYTVHTIKITGRFCMRHSQAEPFCKATGRTPEPTCCTRHNSFNNTDSYKRSHQDKHTHLWQTKQSLSTRVCSAMLCTIVV